jgi:hypothetical protein
MNEALSSNWDMANHRYLMTAIAQIRHALKQQIAAEEPFSASLDLDAGDRSAFQDTPPALEQLCRIFKLSALERDIVLLCAGMEIDGYWGDLCADAQGHPQRDYPTLSLALTISSTLNWGVLTPDAPLRRWRLVEIGAGNALSINPLRLDEQIWHYLIGSQHLDERLGRLGASEVRGG